MVGLFKIMDLFGFQNEDWYGDKELGLPGWKEMLRPLGTISSLRFVDVRLSKTWGERAYHQNVYRHTGSFGNASQKTSKNLESTMETEMLRMPGYRELSVENDCTGSIGSELEEDGGSGCLVQRLKRTRQEPTTLQMLINKLLIESR
jgi:hypothetical protein